MALPHSLCRWQLSHFADIGTPIDAETKNVGKNDETMAYEIGKAVTFGLKAGSEKSSRAVKDALATKTGNFEIFTQYGERACINLAQTESSLAMNNADNFATFVQYVGRAQVSLLWTR
jgi:hypothetical protein